MNASSEEHVRRSLGYIIPGFSIQQLKQAIGGQYFDQVKQFKSICYQMISQTKEFNQDEFYFDITKHSHKQMTDAVDLSRLSQTERAFHLAYDWNRKVKSDYEAMVNPQEMKKEVKDEEMELEDVLQHPLKQDLTKQGFCQSTTCPGTDDRWIKCSSKKHCWYHFSCAQIPTNKTQEEIDQMVWFCQNCQKAKLSKRK